MTMEERLQCLPARPEVASLNLTPDMSKFKLKARPDTLPDPHGEIIYDECVPFSYKLVSQFAARMKEYGVKPEMETYHSGGSWVMRDLIQQGLIEAPYWIQTVMGYQTSSMATPENVINLVREFPEGAMWLCSGIGPHQLPMTTLAIILGGHVRVGLEDNIYYRRGELVKSNAQLVERTVRLAHELGREVATPAQRARCSVSPPPHGVLTHWKIARPFRSTAAGPLSSTPPDREPAQARRRRLPVLRLRLRRRGGRGVGRRPRRLVAAGGADRGHRRACGWRVVDHPHRLLLRRGDGAHPRVGRGDGLCV
ncbi:MAG: 3-keto-5-aminohexanoate cleavage protein [Gemmatimonadetes bacterium]|nr:3-keto-5-aminohexanoate cleavage protein [Gemmatimonadota bacterium]